MSTTAQRSAKSPAKNASPSPHTPSKGTKSPTTSNRERTPSPLTKKQANLGNKQEPTPQKEEKVPPVDPEIENLKKKVNQDANNLLDYITIEMTVGSQMDSTKKQLKELTKLCRDENRMIIDLENQIKEEERKAEDMDQNGNPEDYTEDKEIDVIVELERQLKSLYAEKAALLNKKKKK